MGKIASKLDGLFFNFLIPLGLTIGLILISLKVLGFDMKNMYTELINDIPMINTTNAEKAKTGKAVQNEGIHDELEKVKKELAQTEKSYHELQQKYNENQKELKQYHATLKNSQTDRSDVDHQAAYKKLAKVYIEMSPTKAAAILENLDMNEAASLLNVMTVSQQGDLLSRMTPEKASKITMLLKDHI